MWNEYVRKLGVYLLQVIEENNSQRGKEMLKTRIKKQAAKEREKVSKKKKHRLIITNAHGIRASRYSEKICVGLGLPG